MTSMINEEIRHIIEPELQSGEKLLWADKPARRPYPWRGVCRAIFWFMWMAFAGYFTPLFIYGAFATPASLEIIFPVIGFIFLVFGWSTRKVFLEALFGPKFEVYGLTDKRAIILSPLWADSEAWKWQFWGHDHTRQSVYGKDLDIISVSCDSGMNIGTIIFKAWWNQVRYKIYIRPDPTHSPNLMANLNGFRNIRNADQVANLIEKQFGQKTKSHSQLERVIEVDQKIEPDTLTDEQNAKDIKYKRILLFSIFPVIWIIYTLLPLPFAWKFISFFTFPIFFTLTIYAIREAIRPTYTYRT